MRKTASTVFLAGLIAGVWADGHSQGTLEQFSYDSVGFRGVQAGVGVMLSNKVKTTPHYNVQVHLGEFAPRLRIMLGAAYFKEDLTDDEISRLEEGILQVVDDPGGTANVNLGSVSWSDLAVMGDAQYLLGRGRKWQPYIGAGVSLHFRNGSGDRINGTVIEDNLDRLQVGLDLTAGTDILLTPSLVVNLGVRGVITGSLNTLSIGVGLGYRVP